jgi:hypothetical protein
MKPLDDLLDACDIIIPLARTNYGGTVIPALRRGVMWHFDDSSSDKGAENWFRDPAFKLSYNRAYTDNGRRIRLTPSINTIAYHGGVGIREPGLRLGLGSGRLPARRPQREGDLQPEGQPRPPATLG